MAKLTAVLTCSACGHSTTEQMPTDRCVHFYTCRACGARLEPKTGHCCVFCSYADTKCPAMQDTEQRTRGA